MAEPSILQQAIDAAQTAALNAPETNRPELLRLIQDLEEAKTALFVRTAEARPLLERCQNAARALADSGARQEWDRAARDAFDEFERAVTKLRNTILVRTQRAT